MIRRIGIVGGGQLGKMLTIAAKQLGFYVAVIDPTPGSPAGQVADRQIIADYKDEKAIRELAKEVDVVTFEIELANDKVLTDIMKNGKEVHPSPQTLSIIRDKFIQKNFLHEHNIPTAEFQEVNTYADIEDAVKSFGYPLLLKAKTDAYDGRGNALIKSKRDIPSAMEKLQGRELYVERFVPFVKELAVMVARSPKGNIVVYPVVETYHKDNILDFVIAPAQVKPVIATKAKNLAKNVMKHLKGAGVFGIEMFLTREGRVLINEIAPRVHNSGHYTIEATVTSQFEQHIRAVTGLPLGETKMKTKFAVMKNILGTKHQDGMPEGVEKVLKLAGVSLHIYGKKESRPARKMGHMTLTGSNLAGLKQQAHKARKALHI